MRLKKILKDIDVVKVKNFKDYSIKNITHICNDVVKSSMFICIKGNNFDGNDFVNVAIDKGAKCVVTENESCAFDNVCVIVVKDCRVAMSLIAKNFYNKCADSLKIIGIIGTSGKTTTSLMIAQLLRGCGKKIGVIGTNGIYINNIRQDNKFTTPDPLELHYVFFQMRMLGVEIVIMEVSAQAIYYKKVAGIKFDICVFTNISREHLDFFGSMEKYAKTKMNFFNKGNMKECVINIDDFFGRELAYKVDIPCVSYGLVEPANSFAVRIDCMLDRTTFVANILDEVINIDVPFVGEYNVYNLIASLTVVKMLCIKNYDIVSSVANMNEIEGRYNVYQRGDKKVIIDFAHTPESIDKLLSHIRSCFDGDIVSVYGCVGYSDKDKRVEMSQSVARYSNYVIVTTDNRGDVEFDNIANDMVCGLGNVKYECIEDRMSAIKRGYELIGNNSILVVIGKGAENFQTIGKERISYNDRDSVLEIMEMSK